MALQCCMKFNDQGTMTARLCVNSNSYPAITGWTCANVADCKDCPAYPGASEAQSMADEDSPGSSQYAVNESDPAYSGTADQGAGQAVADQGTPDQGTSDQADA